MSKRTARNNIRRRGNTYTYYVYGVGPDGQRKQYSQGGFATQKDALAAQTRASAALLDGSFVADERQTFASFLVDEWLPTKRPPTLEESTFHSYERNLRLHVIPNVGAVRLAGLTPMHLNQLYRDLLDSGRRPPATGRRRFTKEAINASVDAQERGESGQQIADMLNADESFGLKGVTRHAVAALLRRDAQQAVQTTPQDGLSHTQVLDMALGLEVPEVLTVLRKAFPHSVKNSGEKNDGGFDEAASYHPRGVNDYGRLETEILTPMECTYEFVREIGTGIAHHFGAFG